MKNKIVSILIIAAIAFVTIAAVVPTTYKNPGSGGYLYTANTGWYAFRTPATETGSAAFSLSSDPNCDFSHICVNEATIAATNGLIDTMGGSGPGWGGNCMEVAFYSNDTDDDANETFDFELFAYADSLYGPPIMVYSTTGSACALGTQMCEYDPIDGTAQSGCLWADTIAGTDYWNGVTVLDNGNNHIARIVFDMRGYRYFWLRTFNQNGTGEVGSLGAVYKTY